MGFLRILRRSCRMLLLVCASATMDGQPGLPTRIAADAVVTLAAGQQCASPSNMSAPVLHAWLFKHRVARFSMKAPAALIRHVHVAAWIR